MCSLPGARPPRRRRAPGSGGSGRPRAEARSQPPLVVRRRHVGRIAGQHLGDARRVVEADERLGDDEAALGQVGAGVGEPDGRLQHGHMVVAEVADDRSAAATSRSASSKATSRDPAPTRLWRPRRPFSTDSSRKPARAPARSRRYAPRGVMRSAWMADASSWQTKKTLRRGSTSGAGCEDASGLAGDAPAPLAAPSPPGADGSRHRRRA